MQLPTALQYESCSSDACRKYTCIRAVSTVNSIRTSPVGGYNLLATRDHMPWRSRQFQAATRSACRACGRASAALISEWQATAILCVRARMALALSVCAAHSFCRSAVYSVFLTARRFSAPSVAAGLPSQRLR